MKRARLPFILAVGVPTAGFAATIASYDGGADTPYSLEFYGDPNFGGPPIVDTTDGNPGGYLKLTSNVNSQNNWSMFDQTDPGTFPVASFSFDFRFDQLGANGADGISFNFFNTASFGTTGPIGSARFTPEDPNLLGVLGFGFDTWGNAQPIDYVDPNTQAEFGSNYSEISLFYNGNPIMRIDDTRALPVGAFNLKDGAWHTASGVVNFQGGTVTLNVDTTPIFTNFPVSGLAPFSSRIGFAGRTGGANERSSIDNVNVQYGVIPEPASLSMAGLGGILLLRRRRCG
jgi:hypothetical protein